MNEFYNTITDDYTRQKVNDALTRAFDVTIVDISLESTIVFLATSKPDIKNYLEHELGAKAQRILEENLKTGCELEISLTHEGLFNIRYAENVRVINEDLTYNVLLTNNKRYLPLPISAKHLWVMEFANLFMRYIKDTSNVFEKYHE